MADLEAELAGMRQVYDAELAKIKAQCSDETLLVEYTNAVVTAMSKAKSEGDLSAYMEAKKEIERVKRDRSVPAESAVGMSRAIAAAQASFQARRARAYTELNGRILRTFRQYEAQLGAKVKALVKADRMDDAVSVQAEIDRVRDSDVVRACEFAEASGVFTQPETAERSPPVAAVRTSRSQKDIPATGTRSSPWTLTTVRVERGDKVVISAKGTWRCGRWGESLGPAGYTTPSYSQSHVVRSRGGDLTTSTVVYANSGSYYYGNRQVPFQGNPYGALLVRVGSAGQVRTVGERLTFVSDEFGVLSLRCNVTDDWDQRKACEGSMTVTIEASRGGGS
jgi:hypothetical protein